MFFDGKAAEGVGGTFLDNIKNKGLALKKIKPEVLELLYNEEKNHY
jgi:hypothetical protein